ncbi:DUF4158 domain-containing protein, partial [Actinomadura sp. NPDC023710]|uniref:DUF4158 domain-containing protein n=1 Tax=Actinomadura sp. NPDC023710 TaxID=3158219 RepID=UPI0033EEEDD0
MPWPVVDYLAGQLEIGDPSQVKRYVVRPQTAYDHAWMIRDAYGYRVFEDRESWQERVLAKRFLTFLHGRAWTHSEGPTALFEQSAGWLRRNRVLLPGGVGAGAAGRQCPGRQAATRLPRRQIARVLRVSAMVVVGSPSTRSRSAR